MKNFKKLVVIMLVLCLAITMVACGPKQEDPVTPPEGPTQPDKPVTPPEGPTQPDKPVNPNPPVEQMITSAEVVDARNLVENLSTNNYNFKLNFSLPLLLLVLAKL